MGINLVRHKYSNDPNKNKTLFIPNFVGNVHARDIVSQLALIVVSQNYPTHHTFNQALKTNKNPPNKQFISNRMTGRPLPFTYRSRSNRRDKRDRYCQRSPIITSILNSTRNEQYHKNSSFKSPIRLGSPYPESQNFRNNQAMTIIILLIHDHNHLIIAERIIVPGHRSHESAIEMYETTLTQLVY